MRREQIAAELLANVPAESRADHELIANEIRGGSAREQILSMAEVDLWPETYFWLKQELT